ADGMAELGADVVLVDLDADLAEAKAAQIAERHGTRAAALRADLEDESETRAIPAQVLDRFGRIDILLNAAALVSARPLPGWTAPFEQQESDIWRRALEINLTAAFELIQACVPAIRASGHGSIVNIGSTYGLVGPDYRIYEGTAMGNAAAYAASKGGLLQLTRWLATTLAPEIRVNAITPGGVARGQAESFIRRY